MRGKRFVAILLAAVLLTGCGEKNDISSDVQKETEQFSLNENELKERGYEKLLDIAYVKIEQKEEKPVCYIEYYKNTPQPSLYLMALLGRELDCDFVFSWNGEKYIFNDEATEDIEKTFPTDWKEIIEQSQEIGIENIITKATADMIEDKVSDFIESYKKATEKEENTEESNEELIDKFEWKYNENNYFTVGLFKNKETGKENIAGFCHYLENNTGLMQNDFVHIWMHPYSKEIDVNIHVSVGENSYSYLMNDGKLLVNDVPLEPSKEIPDEYMESFEEMRDCLNKFYERNGIL